MKIYLVASGASLSGGVGTYIKDLISLFPESLLISDDREADIRLVGIRRIPTIAGIYRFLKFKRKNKGIYIYHSTAGLILSIVANLFLAERKNIIVYHGLASRYSGFFVRIVEFMSCKLNHINVFMNYEDPAYLKANRFTFIPNYSSRVIAKRVSKTGDIVTVTRNTPQKDNSTVFKVAGMIDERIVLYTNQHDVPFFETKSIPNLLVKSTRSKDEIYNQKSMFVLATFSEGFPLSVVEAACSGLPILCSKLPILEGIFSDNVLYFTDYVDLKDKINKLLRDPGLHNDFSNRSIKLAREYTHDTWKENWSTLLLNLK